MSKEDGSTKEPVGSSGSLKRQRSDDSFNSMCSDKLDLIAVVLKEDGQKVPTSAEVFVALQEIEGLDEDIELDLYDILTSNARKFESMMALPKERRKRWLMKQLERK
uniref:Uncharacterized protein n=1 Tax=Arundo donax TaxID=35708 RepID=A0A0A9H3T2_ARUDO